MPHGPIFRQVFLSSASAAVKAYHPSENSLGSGQVLHCPYSAERARLVLREMAEQLALDLVSKKLMTDQIVLTVGYDIENLTDPARRNRYHGPIVKDHYGREVPKHAHGTERLNDYTSSTKKIMGAATALFDRIVNTDLMVRRLNIVAGRVISESEAMTREGEFEQMDLFTDYAAVEVSISSPSALIVWMFCSSKKISTSSAFRARTVSNNMTVFLANREMDLVSIISTRPARQSASRR